MKRLLGSLMLTSLLVINFAMLVLPGRTAQAATKPSPQAFPVSGCAVTEVVLHGYHPATITCKLWKTNKSSVQPDTQIQSCYDNGNGSITAIFGADQGDVCLAGTGYLGIHLTHIYYFTTSRNGWMALYPSGSTSGIIYSFYADQVAQGSYPADGKHDITQFCEGC